MSSQRVRVNVYNNWYIRFVISAIVFDFSFRFLHNPLTSMNEFFFIRISIDFLIVFYMSPCVVWNRQQVQFLFTNYLRIKFGRFFPHLVRFQFSSDRSTSFLKNLIFFFFFQIFNSPRCFFKIKRKKIRKQLFNKKKIMTQKNPQKYIWKKSPPKFTKKFVSIFVWLLFFFTNYPPVYQMWPDDKVLFPYNEQRVTRW